MNERSRNINGKEQLGINTWADTDILLRPEDLVLLSRIGDYFRGYQDIEDVKSDPEYSVTNNSIAEMISVFDPEASQHKANEKYIRESVAMENEEEKLNDEFNDIKGESMENDIGKITAEWVREWDEKQQKNGSTDAESKERKEFITNSLEKAENESESIPAAGNSKILKKTILTRFALPAAAAVIGALFLIKSLLPSHDPDKIFKKYYEPLNAISPVTRSIVTSGSENYIKAIGYYKSGDYKAATAGFSNAIKEDELNNSPRFFMGISQMALGNYDQTVKILEDVVNRQGEYLKEARWYLGLVYIKTGNIEKASVCFDILAQSPGFYSDRAEKILRRLR